MAVCMMRGSCLAWRTRWCAISSWAGVSLAAWLRCDTHTHTHAYTHVHIHAHTCTDIHTRTHTHTHTHTHTQVGLTMDEVVLTAQEVCYSNALKHATHSIRSPEPSLFCVGGVEAPLGLFLHCFYTVHCSYTALTLSLHCPCTALTLLSRCSRTVLTLFCEGGVQAHPGLFLISSYTL
jgi:hypothetical protein